MFHSERPIIDLQAAQIDMRLVERLHPHTLNNHRSVAVEIMGQVDENIFAEALQKVMERHEVLHAKLYDDSNHFGLEIIPLTEIDELPFQYVDAREKLTPQPLLNLQTTLHALNLQSFIESPFVLDEGPLWRALLLRVADEQFQFLLLANHLIVDEGSLGVMLTDFSHFYNLSFIPTELKPLENLPSLQDVDLSLPEQEKLKRFAFWKNKLKNLNTINLGPDFTTDQPFQFQGKRLPFSLELSLVKQIESNPLFNGYSLNQILLTCLYTLLYRYSDETDICIGITSANRRNEKMSEKLMAQRVNCFFNPVPLRLIFSKEIDFVELLKEVKGTLSESLKNQLALNEIMENTEIISTETKKSLSISTPFNFLLVLNRKKPTLTLHNTKASDPKELDLGGAKLSGLAINLDELTDGSYSGFIEMNTCFKEEAVQRFLNYFMAILHHITLNPQAKISTIPLLSKEDKKKLESFNPPIETLSSNEFVHDFFHSQAVKFPDKSFLNFRRSDKNTEKMTYNEVDQLSNRIANYLLSIGVRKGSFVGISLNRSLNFYISIFAILKAGAVFVPLEHEACESLIYKVHDTKMSKIIVDDTTQTLFSNYSESLQLINLSDAKTKFSISEAGKDYIAPVLTEKDAAYIMYTSGTTAQPKGVILSHGGWANLLNALKEKNFKDDSRVICPYKGIFDASLYNLLVVIITHGELHFCYEEGRYSPQNLYEMIKENQIDFGVFLPDLLSKLNPKELPILDITSMGETPNLETLKLWQISLADRVVRTGYGLTEGGIADILETLDELENDPTVLGRPLSGVQIYVLTSDLALCPTGIRGQIYIGGSQVALGFVGDIPSEGKLFYAKYNDELNCFIPCDESEQSAIRLYATGDEGCFTQLIRDRLGIKFLGRKDRQIKMHGVRVDLGIIENLIRNHPYIQDVVVMPNPDNTQLTAFIVPKVKEIEFQTLGKEIRAYIDDLFDKTSLPPVACPQLLTFNNEWPLNSNGKINVRALPETFHFVFNDALKPQTLLQKTLRDIWASVLNLPKKQIGINKRFKFLGGDSHSLLPLEMMLNQKLDLEEYVGIDILSPTMTIESLEAALISKMKKEQQAEPISLVQMPSHVSIVGNSIFYTDASPSQQPAPTQDNKSQPESLSLKKAK